MDTSLAAGYHARERRPRRALVRTTRQALPLALGSSRAWTDSTTLGTPFETLGLSAGYERRQRESLQLATTTAAGSEPAQWPRHYERGGCRPLQTYERSGGD